MRKYDNDLAWNILGWFCEEIFPWALIGSVGILFVCFGWFVFQRLWVGLQ